MSLARKNNLIVGLALFSMFFGAGNIVFPLYLGAGSAQPIYWTMIGFVITGVGIPLLGLVSVSLYKGDYWQFLGVLGKIPAFLVATFIAFIIGPLFATPRTVVVAFETLRAYMPSFLSEAWVFNAMFVLIAFYFATNAQRMIRILGLYLTPIMLILFTLLISVGLYQAHTPIPNNILGMDSFKLAVTSGYDTMDLLGAIFFSQIAYYSISTQYKTQKSAIIIKSTIKASLIAGFLLSAVYAGFILLSYYHADVLYNIPRDQAIWVVTNKLLGKFSSLFICVAVSIACMSTAVALIEVSATFFYRFLFLKRIDKLYCYVLVIVLIYLMTHLGFEGIMKIAHPILVILYPLLITFCMVQVVMKLTIKNRVSLLSIIKLKRQEIDI